MKRRWITAAVVTLMIVIPTAATARTAGSHIPHIHPGRAILDYRFPTTRSAPERAATGVTVKSFTAKITDGTKTFSYSMVGKNPGKTQANPVTNVPTYLVPVKFVFPNMDAYDPTATDTCDTVKSPITRVQESPIFVSSAYKWGGTNVGNAQYVDAFRRAEFWRYTKKTGINPGYHVNLVPTTLPVVTVNVPDGDWAEAASASACGVTLGAIELNWWDHYVKSTLLPSLSGSGVGPTDFPLFVFGNVVMFINTTGNCCVLGYHSATNTAGGVQTYGNSDYDTTGGQLFNGVSDVSVLAHEVSEWMDDPFVNDKSGGNPTKPWGHIGQVSGCQSNLETGDPLTGTNLPPITTTGYDYTAQELAFFSWFYHQKPSLGINGWYSNNGTFTTPAKKCV